MTRTITTAVDSLYSATQHVQDGDLTYRVRLPHRDQLAALGESFNSMMQSVSTLIEEQRQRQKLENELSIAHEVQQQLFPRTLPNLQGIEIEAICRPARVVSGDYYDFIRISPTRLAIAVADISGKGISAALLMANVQAALRSDVLRYRNGQPGIHLDQIDTAEIVSHLNLHLFRNTSDERYATVFFGVYDAETRQLHYTNAGHLPPIYICGDKVRRLETGGMVVGLFNDVPFQQGAVEIEHGGILVAYSDGLIEPENVYGEEFGTTRLIDVATRNKDASSHVIAEAMMHAAEEWSGSPEQADDMTVIVMRFSAHSRGEARVKVLTAAQMREADRLTTERYGIPGIELMENAGTAIAEFLREKFADIASRKILVLCGKGNNGGDGLVVARLLKDFGSAAVVFLFANPGSVEGDAAANLKRWQQGLGELYVVTSEAEWESARAALAEADLIVDALLGTGLRGPVEGLLGKVIEDLNEARAKRRGKTVVVSVDMPSGLASDAQDFGGPVVAADFTVTLTAPKVGQLVLPHSPCCGVLVVKISGRRPSCWSPTRI